MGILDSITGRSQNRRLANAVAAARAQRQTALNFADNAFKPFEQSSAGAFQRLAAGVAPNGEFSQGFQSGFSPSTFNFQADPGFQFRLNQGTDAVQRSAAARGKALSGQTLKDLNRFSQGFAADEFKRAFQRALANDVRNENCFVRTDARRFGRLSNLANQQLNFLNGRVDRRTGFANQNANQALNLAQLQNRQSNAGIGRIAGLAGALGGQLGAVGNALAGSPGQAVGTGIGSALSNFSSGFGFG